MTSNLLEISPRPASLSPSRAADFKTCPLLYRLRTIDRIPEPPSTAATRGTLVHTVLERLFDVPAGARSIDHARTLIAPAWESLQAENSELTSLFAHEDELAQWLVSAGELVEGYFTLEEPGRIEPAERETLVEVKLDSGLILRGFVDRLDIAPNGDIRVVDYKTGKSPSPDFEAKALFQLKFYALVLWRTRGVVPRMLRLMYLADRSILDYPPTESELRRFERTLDALWDAISRCISQQSFPARRNSLCSWCTYQSLCPEFGGQTPEYPAEQEPNR
ncbi:MAG: RecB family exonuclease [Corynebacteriales bacterium]|nr:RecB family exonuclease [Mycobacteriales bacterium]